VALTVMLFLEHMRRGGGIDLFLYCSSAHQQLVPCEELGERRHVRWPCGREQQIHHHYGRRNLRGGGGGYGGWG
jgi:hypothetical protein